MGKVFNVLRRTISPIDKGRNQLTHGSRFRDRLGPQAEAERQTTELQTTKSPFKLASANLGKNNDDKIAIIHTCRRFKY